MRLLAALACASVVPPSVWSAPQTNTKSKAATTGSPSCKGYTCSSGDKHVPKESFTPRSYGCLEIPQLDKCCVERDVCLQTCGMRSKTCFKSFVDCSAKGCGKDSTCIQNAKVLGESTAGKNDKELCETYYQGQQQACECASKYVWKGQLNKRLVDFYKKYQPDKVDLSGRVRDVDRIWQKWEGNESSLFLSLTMKYWDKAVDLKEKTGQTKRGSSKTGASTKQSPSQSKRPSPSPKQKKKTPAQARKTEERGRTKGSGSGSEFTKELRVLEDRMRKAGKKEDYLTARNLQVQVLDLREKEILRLEYAKERAINVEDYVLAKSFKTDQQQLKSEVAKAKAREESSQQQPDTPRSANVDRVGSRARLEREDESIVEAVETHGEEGTAILAENDVVEDVYDTTEETDESESEATNDVDDEDSEL